MGYLPYLSNIATQRDMVNNFGGYNHNARINPYEFFDMKNLSSDNFPLVTPRKERHVCTDGPIPNPQAFCATDNLVWVNNGILYYAFLGQPGAELSPGKKKIAVMGSRVIVFPDKLMFNTETKSWVALEASFEGIGSMEVSSSVCTATGTNLVNFTESKEPPASPANGAYWLDNSKSQYSKFEAPVLKRYYAEDQSWKIETETYVKIEATYLGGKFREGDIVEIDGMDERYLNGSHEVYATTPNGIVLSGLVCDTATHTAFGVTVRRSVPDMDFITVSGNRVWGCSSKNHEIYASALGDPRNWHKFQGISTDSYAATVATPGDFTGIAAYKGGVLFFKENGIHKLMGTQPSNFQLSHVQCRGVQKGCDESVCIVNETLFYKSRGGVMAYAGAMPEPVSDNFGEQRYSAAVAGGHNGKYYISMKKDGTEEYEMFVFDTDKGIWHKEDNTQAFGFASVEHELYMLDAVEKTIKTLTGPHETKYIIDEFSPEGPVEWMAQPGDIGMEDPEQKYVSQLKIRLEIGENSRFCMAVQYDDEDGWNEVYSLSYRRKKTVTVPFVPRRCDTMRIKFYGEGDFTIFSITKYWSNGGDE